jgi:predicted protein tyrosine phosphatase
MTWSPVGRKLYRVLLADWKGVERGSSSRQTSAHLCIHRLLWANTLTVIERVLYFRFHFQTYGRK